MLIYSIILLFWFVNNHWHGVHTQTFECVFRIDLIYDPIVGEFPSLILLILKCVMILGNLFDEFKRLVFSHYIIDCILRAKLFITVLDEANHKWLNWTIEWILWPGYVWAWYLENCSPYLIHFIWYNISHVFVDWTTWDNLISYCIFM